LISSRHTLFTLSFLLSACVQQPVHSQSACDCSDNAAIQIPDVERYAPLPPTLKLGEPAKGKEYQLMREVSWSQLEGYDKDNLSAAWPALLQSCGVLKKNVLWQEACEAALQLPNPSDDQARNLINQYFSPWQVMNPEGTDTGLITGYYEPWLKGSLSRTERYRYPLYQRPDDMVTVELNSLYPELANRKLRGKLEGSKLKPYYSRGEIEITQSPLAGKELLWTDDIIELFFLQIQGSGFVKLDNGEQVRVGYADQNGQPYQSIGKVLIDRGDMTADKASMQGIKDWGRKNLGKLRDLLNSNPSYVFFRELPKDLPGPLGAMGLPIMAERSIAVDPRYIPLGAPVFLSATYPNSKKPLQRLVMAQDTGGAIKGAVRADFFWGAGNEAGKQAGSMKQPGKLWVLMPKGYKPAEIK